MLGWKEYCKRVALTGMCGPGEGVCGGGGGKEYCKRVALTGMCRPGEGGGGGKGTGRGRRSAWM